MPFERAVIIGSSGGIGQALARALGRAGARVHALSRSGRLPDEAGMAHGLCDLADEASIAAAARAFTGLPAAERPDLVLVASGVLTLCDGSGAAAIGPERSHKAIDPMVMHRVFALNTIGPALVAKHFLPLFARDRRSVFAALSARVGSISDNRIGGWHSYRASKAALNMLLKNFAIEQARTHPQCIIAGLHPGTVATRLSAPFARALPQGQIATPELAASRLLAVLERLEASDSGSVFDWKGEAIAW